MATRAAMWGLEEKFSDDFLHHPQFLQQQYLKACTLGQTHHLATILRIIAERLESEEKSENGGTESKENCPSCQLIFEGPTLPYDDSPQYDVDTLARLLKEADWCVHNDPRACVSSFCDSSALHLAVATGQLECTKLLRAVWTDPKNKLDVNVRDKKGQTALLWGCKSMGSAGVLNSVLELLSWPNVDVNVSDEDNYTPIYWAIYHREAEVLKQLIELGGDIQRSAGSARLPNLKKYSTAICCTKAWMSKTQREDPSTISIIRILLRHGARCFEDEEPTETRRPQRIPGEHARSRCYYGISSLRESSERMTPSEFDQEGFVCQSQTFLSPFANAVFTGNMSAVREMIHFKMFNCTRRKTRKVKHGASDIEDEGEMHDYEDALKVEVNSPFPYFTIPDSQRLILQDLLFHCDDAKTAKKNELAMMFGIEPDSLPEFKVPDEETFTPRIVSKDVADILNRPIRKQLSLHEDGFQSNRRRQFTDVKHVGEMHVPLACLALKSSMYGADNLDFFLSLYVIKDGAEHPEGPYNPADLQLAIDFSGDRGLYCLDACKGKKDFARVLAHLDLDYVYRSKDNHRLCPVWRCLDTLRLEMLEPLSAFIRFEEFQKTIRYARSESSITCYSTEYDRPDSTVMLLECGEVTFHGGYEISSNVLNPLSYFLMTGLSIEMRERIGATKRMWNCVFQLEALSPILAYLLGCFNEIEIPGDRLEKTQSLQWEMQDMNATTPLSNMQILDLFVEAGLRLQLSDIPLVIEACFDNLQQPHRFVRLLLLVQKGLVSPWWLMDRAVWNTLKIYGAHSIKKTVYSLVNVCKMLRKILGVHRGHFFQLLDLLAGDLQENYTARATRLFMHDHNTMRHASPGNGRTAPMSAEAPSTNNVASLQKLSRLAFHQGLKVSPLDCMSKLGLPSSTTDYLMFKDEIDFDEACKIVDVVHRTNNDPAAHDGL